MLCTNQEAKGLGHCIKLNSQNCSQILLKLAHSKVDSYKLWDLRYWEDKNILTGDFCLHMGDTCNGDMHVGDTYSFVLKKKPIKNVGLSWMLYKMCFKNSITPASIHSLKWNSFKNNFKNQFSFKSFQHSKIHFFTPVHYSLLIFLKTKLN